MKSGEMAIHVSIRKEQKITLPSFHSLRACRPLQAGRTQIIVRQSGTVSCRCASRNGYSRAWYASRVERKKREDSRGSNLEQLWQDSKNRWFSTWVRRKCTTRVYSISIATADKSRANKARRIWSGEAGYGTTYAAWIQKVAPRRYSGLLPVLAWLKPGRELFLAIFQK